MGECETDGKCWRKFVKKHWSMLVFWIVAAVFAVVGVVLVYLWFVEEVQTTEMVPMVFGQWSMSHMITFVLHLIMWEVLIIGIPVAVVAGIGYFWWKRIPLGDGTGHGIRGRFEGSRSSNRAVGGTRPAQCDDGHAELRLCRGRGL